MSDPTPPPVPPAPPAAPAAPPPEPRPPALAFAGSELARAWRSPGLACDVVLAHPDRLARTIAGPDVLLRLVGVLAVCTLLASLPFGFVRDPVGCWKVAVLFGGTVLVCVPSLQVFGAFVGRALHPAQTFALALVLSSTAAMFSLGFFPILWFLEVSMAEGERVGHRALTAVMLVAAMAAGVVQMLRTARHDDSCGPLRLLPLLLPWQILVAFVAVRMARWLGI